MNDNAIQPGEVCCWCRKEPAQERFRFYPAIYFCSMECKRAWYVAPEGQTGPVEREVPTPMGMKPHRAEPVLIDFEGERYGVGLSEDGMLIAIENEVLDRSGFVWIDRRVWPRIVEAVATVENRARVLAQAENTLDRAVNGEEG